MSVCCLIMPGKKKVKNRTETTGFGTRARTVQKGFGSGSSLYETVNQWFGPELNHGHA